MTPEGRVAIGMTQTYGEVLPFLPKAMFLEDFLFGHGGDALLPSLRTLVSRARERWGLQEAGDPLTAKVQQKLRRHLDGILVGPTMVALAREGVLDRMTQDPLGLKLASIEGNRECLSCVFDLLCAQGWANRDETRISLTPAGRYALQIATSYGVTVSYFPLLEVLSTLLFGNALIPRVDEHGTELLVSRGMNLWGSGGAHQTYFHQIDEIVAHIFNRPLQEQPCGICDMGCGDGTLLEHLYGVIRDGTVRGHALELHPLVLVEADFNKVARRLTKRRLRQANIPKFYVIHGDINRPAKLASDLEQLEIVSHELLHVRSFLDHTRPFLPLKDYVTGTRTARTTGAFAVLGQEIPPDVLEENLVRHLRRWAPYAGRFGLLILELHTLPPERIAANLGRTLAVPYDATHGYSDQYLVEPDVFLECAREAGLIADEQLQAKFPPSELATVSINFFRARGERDRDDR